MTSYLDIDPPVIAHRGASGYAPENTMAAFSKAAQLGIKWVEFDVMLSQDNVPIIYHDETLTRTTDAIGDPEALPYTYLQTLDAGKWFNHIYSGERIPTLLQVVDFLISMGMKANIEIKSSEHNELKTVETIIECLANYLAEDYTQFLFSSFSVNALHYLREFSTQYRVGLLLHEWSGNWQQHCRALDVISVHVYEKIMTKERANEIKAMKKMLLCYTVNSTTRAKELYQMGVDAVFSDVPDKIALMPGIKKTW